MLFAWESSVINSIIESTRGRIVQLAQSAEKTRTKYEPVDPKICMGQINMFYK